MPRNNKKAIITLLTIIFLLCINADFVESKEIPKLSFDVAVKHADIIFSGVVVKKEFLRYTDNNKIYYIFDPMITFWIQDIWKGNNLKNDIFLISDKIYDFDFGEKYLVYATYDSISTDYFHKTDTIDKSGYSYDSSIELYSTSKSLRTCVYNDTLSDIKRLNLLREEEN